MPLPPTTNPPDSLRDNLRKARDLLAEAGWTYRDGALRNAKGEPFTVEFLDSGAAASAIVTPCFQALAQARHRGAVTGAADFALIQKRLDVFDFDLFTIRMPGQRSARAASCVDRFGCNPADTEGSGNLIGIKDPAVDALLDRWSSADDAAGARRARCARSTACCATATTSFRSGTRARIRIAYRARQVRAAARLMPPYYQRRRLGRLDLVDGKRVRKLHVVLHPQAPAADDADAASACCSITFVVIQFVPGGPVEQMVSQLQGRDARRRSARRRAPAAATAAGRASTRKRIEEIKKLYGFDKPAHERFVQMLGQFARFDLGTQLLPATRTCGQLIKEKLPVSISLGLWTFFITYLISVPLGHRQGGARRHALRLRRPRFVVLVGYAIPGFVLGVVLLVLFGGGSFVQWFPLRGLTSINWDELELAARKIADYLWHITLPVTAMVLGSFAVITMLTKNSFLEEIRKQYVLTARAKGVDRAQVLWKHVFRNALIPIITGFPAAFVGAFFTGSLLIETLFSLDGLGLLSLRVA